MARSVSAKSITGFILLLLLSAVFIFSAVTKFITIEPFEWTFMDMGFPNAVSFFLARFFIGFEFLLALFMLAHLYLKRFTYPLTILFLMVMTLYLVVLLITKGNNVDCGCFGDQLPMTPVQSIVKNLVLLALVFILLKIYPVKPYRFQLPLSLAGAAVTLALPYLFVPYSQKPSPINLNPLYQNTTGQPSVDLRKGKHLIAFMSLGCMHCRNLAKTFDSLYQRDPSLPVMMVLKGYAADTADFFKETHSQKVPHIIYSNTEAFMKMTGEAYVPVIYWVNNGIKERKLTLNQINSQLLKSWEKN